MSYDDRYINPGTDGRYRFLFTFNNPRDISIIKDWHELFFWKCKEIRPRGFGSFSRRPDNDEKIKEFLVIPYYEINYPGLDMPFLGFAGLDGKNNDDKPFAVFTFERLENIKFHDELAEIQEKCEKNIRDIYYAREMVHSSLVLKLLSPIRRKKVEEAKEEMNKLIEETNALFERLKEIRLQM